MRVKTTYTMQFTGIGRLWHRLWMYVYIMLILVIAVTTLPVFTVLRALVDAARVTWHIVANPSDKVKFVTGDNNDDDD